MSTDFSLYPATPAAIPRHLVNPSGRYRLLVVGVLMSLLLFVVLYLALVAASGYLVYLSVAYPMGQVSKGTILLKGGAIAVSVMLFLFLLKGLFKSHQVDTTKYVALREEENPALFRFLRELCRDTGAPFPRQVFVNPEVNAAVFYNSSLLSLILPVRKNLLIGLGLVNVLDLNEFKAVLAHEFGHFSQSSMKVGSYVYMANRIITDMVYGRDSWDNLLREWQNSDFRLAVFGWGLGGIVWGLPEVLAGIFRVLNLGNLALSRQMEFNADLVAVSVTGSDALIHALAKLDFANQSLMQACKDLQDASDHRLYSADMFYHQTRAAPHLRALLKNPLLGKIPELPPDPAARVQVFQPGVGAIPHMWASHPTNFDREENAKRHYFRSLADERSPWDLFGDAAAVRARITHDWYKTWTEPSSSLILASPEKVQAFIDEEHTETTYDPKYHGLYDNRYLEPGDIVTMTPYAVETLAGRRQDLYGDTLKNLMESNGRRLGEFDYLMGLRHGPVKMAKGTFSFRDREYHQGEIERLLKKVEEELTEDRRQLALVDREVFMVHLQMARTLEGGESKELMDRYRFHLGQQGLFRDLLDHRGRVDGTLNFLAGGPQLTEADMAEVIQTFRNARKALANALADARHLSLPRLKNMRGDEDLARFLLDEPLVSDLIPGSTALEGSWIGTFLKQFSLVQDRLRRMHFKSMGGILALQEQIAQAWENRRPAEAT